MVLFCFVSTRVDVCELRCLSSSFFSFLFSMQGDLDRFLNNETVEDIAFAAGQKARGDTTHGT